MTGKTELYQPSSSSLHGLSVQSMDHTHKACDDRKREACDDRKGKVRNDTVKKPTRGWPPARRIAQAARCRRMRPWRHSTGPKTPAGKAVIARNALCHGTRSRAFTMLRSVLRDQRRYMQVAYRTQIINLDIKRHSTLQKSTQYIQIRTET